MNRLSRRPGAILVSLVAAGALALSVATGALAYGNRAVYQIGLSFNCQNRALCVASPQNPFGIGGGWGWIELDPNGTGDIAFEGQGHDNVQPYLNGAVHIAGDVSWTLSSDRSTLIVVLPVLPSPENVLLLPAVPGHYQLPPSGPGMSNQVQINLIP